MPTVSRHHLDVVERRSIDINRDSPRPVRACDEYLPFPLLFPEAEEICLIIYLKIQQLFVPLKNRPRISRIFTDINPQSVLIRGSSGRDLPGEPVKTRCHASRAYFLSSTSTYSASMTPSSFF
jgi:hypothetical protein